MAASKFVAPEGGWGWIIVMAYALNNLITIPIMQSFGLVFKDAFTMLGLTAIDATVIININSAFGMVLGLINGPLLRNYGYRKISIAGGIMYASGVILTAFASNFLHFVITYGMMASLGMGLSMSSYSLALNTYFNKKRGRAVGLAMTITGLGPIFMPPFTSLLLSTYGTQGTMLILGAMSFHSLIGALLLHPIEWHAKEAISLNKDETCETNEEMVVLQVQETDDNTLKDNRPTYNSDVHRRKRTMTASSIDHDVETASIYGYETPMPTNRRFSSSHYKSTDGINLGSSMKIFEEDLPECGTEKNEKHLHNDDDNNKCNNVEKAVQANNNDANVNSQKQLENATNSVGTTKKKSIIVRWMSRMSLFFDLDLLRDPIYVNLMLGLSIAVLAELNFSTLTPFILADMFLSTNQIAMVMSTIGTGDLIFRGIAPYIGEWLKQPARIMYLCSLILLVISRSSLLFTKTFTSILAVASMLGIAKGFRTVYMTIVIPNYVPLEKLPSASSIQMVVNGCLLIIGGPIIGLIRDVSGSYTPCIGFINGLTTFTVIMWLTELIVVWIRKK